MGLVPRILAFFSLLPLVFTNILVVASFLPLAFANILSGSNGSWRMRTPLRPQGQVLGIPCRLRVVRGSN